MAPSPEADRRTLIKRLSIDLTGLPPTPEEVDFSLNLRIEAGRIRAVPSDRSYLLAIAFDLATAATVLSSWDRAAGPTILTICISKTQ